MAILILQAFGETGILYGCLELAERITAAGKLPQQFEITDSPEMVFRGACIGVQKPYLSARQKCV